MSKGINIYKLFTDFSNCINNQSKIIYNRYKDSSNIFKSTPTSKKVFSILESTVSEETKDRAFEQSK